MRLEIEPEVATPRFEQFFDQAGGPLSDDKQFGEKLSEGIAAARGGDRQRARDLLTEVTEQEPSNVDAWLWLASICESPDELLGFLDKVLAVEPDNQRAVQWKNATCSMQAKSFVKRGLTALDAGDTALAEQCFDSAISNDNGYAAAWFHKSKLARDDDERLECLQRVLKLDHANKEARDLVNEITARRAQELFLKAAGAAAAGENNSALELIDRLLGTDAEHVGALTLRSMISSSLEDKLSAFEKILVIEPKNAWARHAKDFVSATLEAVRESSLSEGASASADGVTVAEEEEQLELAPPMTIDSESVESTDEPDLLSAAEVEPVQEPTEVTEDIPIEAAASLPVIDQIPISESGPNGAQEPEDREPTAERSETFAAVPPSDENIHERLTEEAITVTPPSEPEPVDQGPEVSLEASFDENDAVDTTPGEPLSIAQEPAPRTAATLAESEDNPDKADLSDDPTAAETAEEINAALAAYDAITSADPFINGNEQVDEAAHAEHTAFDNPCPFCTCDNDPQAFLCRDCHSVLSVTDIDSLLCEGRCDRKIVQQAVTGMEAEWNLREFDEAELTALALGHFNLNDRDKGLAYLQEASRLSPNNVILAGQVHAIAIRLADMRRQEGIHEGMPKGKTILVVDDSPTVRKLISSKLEKCGHNVVTAVDGVEAIEMLEEVVPDLVLLDIAMPRMDGYSACKLIRANEAVKDVPVVMISGKDGFFDKVRGRMAGTTGYITKPFGPETLMRALETYLLPDVQPAEVEAL